MTERKEGEKNFLPSAGYWLNLSTLSAKIIQEKMGQEADGFHVSPQVLYYLPRNEKPDPVATGHFELMREVATRIVEDNPQVKDILIYELKIGLGHEYICFALPKERMTELNQARQAIINEANRAIKENPSISCRKLITLPQKEHS